MSGRRAVSVLQVSDPSAWAELAVHVHLDALTVGEPEPLHRFVKPEFEAHLPKLAEQGIRVLVRNQRRTAVVVERSTRELEGVIRTLPASTREVLVRAQRHAAGERLYGRHAWDPEGEAEHVRRLLATALLARVPDEDEVYLLNPDLPAPPELRFEAEEAVMPETDDLAPAGPGPVGLLHDLASMAAAVASVSPRRTAQGTLARSDGKKLCKHLAIAEVELDSDPRWGRALRALDALGAVTSDPADRSLHLDLGLESTLAGDTPDAIDHLAHRLIEQDLHEVVALVREALRQAGTGALDELVLMDLLREQHRDVIFHPWRREGEEVYPLVDGEAPRPWDDRGFEEVEAPMIRAAFGRLTRLGLLRRAPGVLAASHDGRVWARVEALPTPPVWATGDLELVVPPHGVSPWERLQIERLGRCVSRDVVDRYKLDRHSLTSWLRTHDVDEAIDLLRRRCAGVPAALEATLRAWTTSASRVVLTRGHVL